MDNTQAEQSSHPPVEDIVASARAQSTEPNDEIEAVLDNSSQPETSAQPGQAEYDAIMAELSEDASETLQEQTKMAAELARARVASAQVPTQETPTQPKTLTEIRAGHAQRSEEVVEHTIDTFSQRTQEAKQRVREALTKSGDVMRRVAVLVTELMRLATDKQTRDETGKWVRDSMQEVIDKRKQAFEDLKRRAIESASNVLSKMYENLMARPAHFVYEQAIKPTLDRLRPLGDGVMDNMTRGYLFARGTESMAREWVDRHADFYRNRGGEVMSRMRARANEMMVRGSEGMEGGPRIDRIAGAARENADRAREDARALHAVTERARNGGPTLRIEAANFEPEDTPLTERPTFTETITQADVLGTTTAASAPTQ